MAELDAASALDVIRGTTRSWEEDPRPYATADEEQLRSILISALNGAFRGQASAERFNGRGKVDITVRSGLDNILLAECKFYNGPNSIRDAVDQLLGYSGWRDQELSLLIFVRSAAMSAALAAVPTAVERSNCIERYDCLDADGAEVMLHGHAPDDPGRPIAVRCLLVHIKTPRTPGGSPGGSRGRKSKPMHPDDLADALLDLQRSIPRNQGVEYTPTLDPGAAPLGPTRGWTVNWSRTTPEGTAGIRAAPRSEEARDEHGPEGALTAPDDRKAREMHLAIRRAEQDLVRVEVKGLGIRFDRIAPLLRDPADRIERADPKRNTVVYGPQGMWQCSVSMDGEDGPITVPMCFLPTDQPLAGWDATLRGTLHDVALTISLRDGVRETGVGWELQLHRQGRVEERLAALRFLKALRGGGRLLIESIEPDLGNGDFTLEPEKPDEEIEWETELWTHVVAIQEHVGREIFLPENPWSDQEWVNGVFTAGAVVQTDTASVFVEPGRATLKKGAELPAVGDRTHLPMEVPLTVRIGDEEIDLGVGEGLVEVRVTSIEDRCTGAIMRFEAASESPVDVSLRASE